MAPEDESKITLHAASFLYLQPTHQDTYPQTYPHRTQLGMSRMPLTFLALPLLVPRARHGLTRFKRIDGPEHSLEPRSADAANARPHCYFLGQSCRSG